MTRIRTALLVVMATAYVSAAGPIDISVGNVQTAFGASIVVSVNVSEVVALDSLRAYEFALIYDPTVLTLTGTDVLGSLSSNIAVYAGVPDLDYRRRRGYAWRRGESDVKLCGSTFNTHFEIEPR